MNKELTAAEKKKLLDKYDKGIKSKPTFNQKKEMYLKQTDRNYKDGDRN